LNRGPADFSDCDRRCRFPHYSQPLSTSL